MNGYEKMLARNADASLPDADPYADLCISIMYLYCTILSPL